MKNWILLLVLCVVLSVPACSPPPKKKGEAAKVKAGTQTVETVISNENSTALSESAAVVDPAESDIEPTVELKEFSDKLSYVLGLDIGTSLRQVQAEVDLDVLQKGLQDSYQGGDVLMAADEVKKIKEEFSAKMKDEYTKMMKEQSEKNLEDGKAFLADNKNKDGVFTTASGLQYMVLKEGDGPMPSDKDRVKVHYSGTLMDGTEFDSSYQRNEPAVFPINGVIPGWTEALQLMKTGSKFKLFIPSELAYGERPVGQIIGPNSVLIFEVELLGIEN